MFPFKIRFHYTIIMEKIIFIFLDGVGIGQDDTCRNPVRSLFADISNQILLDKKNFPESFPGGFAARLDACLGVAGLPQSATGQTSLYTGVNAQAYLGYHLNALPNRNLINLLNKESLPVVLKKKGIRSINANLHSSGFFRSRKGGHKNRFPVSTIMTFAGRIPFIFEQDYNRGRGIFMDITGSLLQEKGSGLPRISPEEAAQRVCALGEDADFVYFEYFLTDRWGHKRDRVKLEHCLDDLIPFLGEIARRAPSEGLHLIITSDHGNAEDFHTGDHTRNDVPLLYLPPDGRKCPCWDNFPRDLTGVNQLIKSIFFTGMNNAN